MTTLTATTPRLNYDASRHRGVPIPPSTFVVAGFGDGKVGSSSCGGLEGKGMKKLGAVCEPVGGSVGCCR